MATDNLSDAELEKALRERLDQELRARRQAPPLPPPPLTDPMASGVMPTVTFTPSRTIEMTAPGTVPAPSATPVPPPKPTGLIHLSPPAPAAPPPPISDLPASTQLSGIMPTVVMQPTATIAMPTPAATTPPAATPLPAAPAAATPPVLATPATVSTPSAPATADDMQRQIEAEIRRQIEAEMAQKRDQAAGTGTAAPAAAAPVTSAPSARVLEGPPAAAKDAAATDKDKDKDKDKKKGAEASKGGKRFGKGEAKASKLPTRKAEAATLTPEEDKARREQDRLLEAEKRRIYAKFRRTKIIFYLATPLVFALLAWLYWAYGRNWVQEKVNAYRLAHPVVIKVTTPPPVLTPGVVPMGGPTVAPSANPNPVRPLSRPDTPPAAALTGVAALKPAADKLVASKDYAAAVDLYEQRAATTPKDLVACQAAVEQLRQQYLKQGLASNAWTLLEPKLTPAALAADAATPAAMTSLIGSILEYQHAHADEAFLAAPALQRLTNDYYKATGTFVTLPGVNQPPTVAARPWAGAVVPPAGSKTPAIPAPKPGTLPAPAPDTGGIEVQ